MIKISVVIPIWNQLKIITKCFDSLYRNWKIEYELIIVDDNSNQSTKDYLKYQVKQFQPRVKLINNVSNNQWYFTQSSIAGIENSQGDYILLLNSDTIITKQAIFLMLETFELDSNIVIVGPSTSSISSKQQCNYAFKNRFNWWNQPYIIEKHAEYLYNLYGNEIEDIDLVGGFCMLIKKSIYDKIPFDPDFLDYGGEKYHQQCLRNKGYRTVWRKAAYVHHLGKMSYSQDKTINIGIRQKDGDKLIVKKLIGEK